MRKWLTTFMAVALIALSFAVGYAYRDLNAPLLERGIGAAQSLIERQDAAAQRRYEAEQRDTEAQRAALALDRDSIAIERQTVSAELRQFERELENAITRGQANAAEARRLPTPEPLPADLPEPCQVAVEQVTYWRTTAELRQSEADNWRQAAESQQARHAVLLRDLGLAERERDNYRADAGLLTEQLARANKRIRSLRGMRVRWGVGAVAGPDLLRPGSYTATVGVGLFWG